MTSLSAPVVKASAMPAGAAKSPAPDSISSAGASLKPAAAGIGATPSKMASAASDPVTMTFNAPAEWADFLKTQHGNQDVFQTKTLETIRNGIALCHANKKPWEEFFPTLLKALALARRKVAKAQGNEDAAEFGKVCKLPIITMLDGQYQSYGNRVNAFMRERLNLWAAKEGGRIDPRAKSYMGWGDEQSRYYLKILSSKEIEAVQRLYKQDKDYQIPLLTSKEGIKVVYPFMMEPLFYLDAKHPDEGVLGPQKTVVIGAIVHKICGVWTTMSIHLTWIKQAVNTPITKKEIDEMGQEVMRDETGIRMRARRSQVLIAHGAPANIPAVEKDVAAVTKRVFSAKSKLEVVNLVAEAQDKLFQQTPWLRGGGNIPENLGAILFAMTGIKTVKFANGRNLFFESHAYPFITDFVAKYREFIVFDPATTLELEKEAASVLEKDDNKKPEGKEPEKT